MTYRSKKQRPSLPIHLKSQSTILLTEFQNAGSFLLVNGVRTKRINMRRECDFSQGTRGKHAGKRIRVIGDKHSHNASVTAARIQQIIERDLKSREDFKVVWSELNASERESIRAAWLKKINTVLAEQPARTLRRA
jgi:hypothetical protein